MSRSVASLSTVMCASNAIAAPHFGASTPRAVRPQGTGSIQLHLVLAPATTVKAVPVVCQRGASPRWRRSVSPLWHWVEEVLTGPSDGGAFEIWLRIGVTKVTWKAVLVTGALGICLFCRRFRPFPPRRIQSGSPGVTVRHLFEIMHAFTPSYRLAHACSEHVDPLSALAMIALRYLSGP